MRDGHVVNEWQREKCGKLLSVHRCICGRWMKKSLLKTNLQKTPSEKKCSQLFVCKSKCRWFVESNHNLTLSHIDGIIAKHYYLSLMGVGLSLFVSLCVLCVCLPGPLLFTRARNPPTTSTVSVLNNIQLNLLNSINWARGDCVHALLAFGGEQRWNNC
jgi:hypothetical protein